MKKQIALVALFIGLSCGNALAQERDATRPYGEVGIGLSFPQLYGGEELLRSEALRDANQSYYPDAFTGIRPQAGAFSTQVGFNMRLAYYKPLRRYSRLHLGGSVTTSQTGSTASANGREEGYFFNFLQAGVASKWYLLENAGLYVGLDAGVASVWTKNRLAQGGDVAAFHQFGIGYGGRISAGYTYWFGSGRWGLDAKAHYEYNSARVEVNGIGDDTWTYGAYCFSLGVVF